MVIYRIYSVWIRLIDIWTAIRSYYIWNYRTKLGFLLVVFGGYDFSFISARKSIMNRRRSMKHSILIGCSSLVRVHASYWGEGPPGGHTGRILSPELSDRPAKTGLMGKPVPMSHSFAFSFSFFSWVLFLPLFLVISPRNLEGGNQNCRFGAWITSKKPPRARVPIGFFLCNSLHFLWFLWKKKFHVEFQSGGAHLPRLVEDSPQQSITNLGYVFSCMIERWDESIMR